MIHAGLSRTQLCQGILTLDRRKQRLVGSGSEPAGVGAQGVMYTRYGRDPARCPTAPGCHRPSDTKQEAEVIPVETQWPETWGQRDTSVLGRTLEGEGHPLKPE